MNLSDIRIAADRAKPHYRHLHRHPELSAEEAETSRYMKEALARLGAEIVDYSRHGFSAEFSGNAKGPRVALRADMDALPLDEKTGLSYASNVPGVMHACGHDMHMAILLGAAIYFSEHRDYPGSIRLIVQPDEEKNGGAKTMVAEGVMEGVDYCMGLHVSPNLDVGTFGVLPGFMYASVDDFCITLYGKGGHAASPEECIDPIVCGGHLIVALQSLVARRLSPFTPAVVSIGSCHAGNKHNIIPETMTLEGTLRADTRENRAQLQQWLKDVAAAVATAHGCRAEIEIIEGYVPLINDPKATEAVRGALEDVFGPSAVETLPTPTMGAEDFAYYLEKAPGSFINLGVRKQGAEAHAVHTAYFYPEEEVLYYGIGAEVASALHFLTRGL
ncbi:MAG: M20 family metallopeptidase [Peptoniphilus sp.]|nr:M20 family metallopeptidase [Peptoniphilus sp.]MDD7363448.1 M20 family metallopeptidase [Bacillota bacterium]MDY6044848.1 M20 family metallopeptidase [Peptoniphilus sp.]